MSSENVNILKFCSLMKCQPFPTQQFLDSSKLKEFADDNFKLDKNDGKCSEWVGNIVGKGEIARHEHFLLFSQCFQKTCTAGM